jgi:hypothetical protein
MLLTLRFGGRYIHFYERPKPVKTIIGIMTVIICSGISTSYPLPLLRRATYHCLNGSDRSYILDKILLIDIRGTCEL